MYTKIKEYLDDLSSLFDLIPDKRKQILEELSKYIAKKSTQKGSVNLVYICTHNSRRSHFGQVWAQVAANYYQIKSLTSYSGGTEATAFNPNAIAALRRIGFDVHAKDQSANPRYAVLFDEQESPVFCFSKVYEHPQNPQSEFAAIMTCSDAEENCPFIPGAELRVGTTYEDPKAFDNTPQQDEKYEERCKQIALETLYVFSKV